MLFDDISLHKIIGEGAFGKVYSGKLLKQTTEVVKEKKSSQHKTNKEQQEMKIGLTVAVKMLQSMICWQQQQKQQQQLYLLHLNFTWNNKND